MNTADYLQMLRDMKDAAFATTDQKGNPQVRVIDVMHVEKDKLYFVTARGKPFYHQLMRTGKVAITAMGKDWKAIRLTGKVTCLFSREWVDQIFAENPPIQGTYPGASRSILEAFCLDQGHGELFDLSALPIYRESFAFGGDTVHEVRYTIQADKCIACGACAKACPQSCIASGNPYRIQSQHCLHCGLCQETCPKGAILFEGEDEC